MQFRISCNTHTATRWWAEMVLNMHHNWSKSFWPFQYLWRAPLPKWQQAWGIAVRPPSTCTCSPPQSHRPLKWHNSNRQCRWWKQSSKMRISERKQHQSSLRECRNLRLLEHHEGKKQELRKRWPWRRDQATWRARWLWINLLRSVQKME